MTTNNPTHDPVPDSPANDAPPKLRIVKLDGADKGYALSMRTEMNDFMRAMQEAQVRHQKEVEALQANWAESVKAFWAEMGSRHGFDGDAAANGGTWFLDTSLHEQFDLVLIREMQRVPMRHQPGAQVGRKLN